MAIIVLCLLWTPSCAFAKQTTPSTVVPMNSADAIVVGQWTADDRPYKEVEARMAKDFATGRSPQAILDEYRILATAQPRNPVSQFAYVCAARGAALTAHPEESLPYELVETLAKHDPNNVHEYTRYRFCLAQEADRILPYQNAKAVGAKLLQYNASDHFVRTSLIYMLCDSDHPREAMPYALKWVKAEPKNEKAHSSLALVYQDMWFATKNKVYAVQAVQEYQQFLRFAPPNDGFRGLAQNSIKVLQQGIARAG